MKKIILSAFAVMAFSFANAQDGNFKLGMNVGIPVGTISDGFSTAGGVDVAYLFNFGEKFSAGMTTGYLYYFANEYEVLNSPVKVYTKSADITFIPIAATAQYSLAKNLFIGADIGYAACINSSDFGSSDPGGFLYQPKVGYQTEKIELYGSYRGISDGGAINVGFNYKF